MMKRFIKEGLLLLLALAPYLYLAIVWTQLPERVAIHFNYSGQADRYADKSTLLFLPTTISILVYILLLVIPIIDPKKRVGLMGEKYNSLRFVLGIFMAVLNIYLLHSTLVGQLKSPKIIHGILGAFIAVTGNYFQTIRPNYFIGIRTPWTLENEDVWKKTHAAGGKLWLIGGCLIVVFSFINVIPNFITLIILAVISVVPIVHSYVLFKRQKATINRDN